MKQKPTYFEPIRLKAARRWAQLEDDPELAGPWHLLFKQVQSPRHVLSELLQNADDAGATEATVRIEDQFFIFEHNGEDFSKDHFASLCRFGYSDKRALHTIGFRGIGFKSTFSLGNCVELYTPTIAVSFDRKRFTEPRWSSDESNTFGKTRVRVRISDQQRQEEVEENLEEWLKSPVSLLFFKRIRRMQIGDRAVHWESKGPGPLPDSEWMSLSEKDEGAFLLLRSEAEAFPEEALTEIKQERMLGVEDDVDFPACKIEIVLGTKGRLFVVLPTGVETELPFACNAPFIQDPARLTIKSPQTSPTNRWLLERAGQLAASAMLSWLAQPKLALEKRAAAYGLFPDVNRDDNSLEGHCGTVVELSFAKAIEGQPLLLTDEGALTRENESVIISNAVADIWPGEQAAALLDDKGRPAVCQHVQSAHRKKLLRWSVVEEVDKQKFLSALQSKHLPKPKTWGQLLNLWAYIAPDITGYRNNISATSLRIVPGHGSDVLYAATEVVRMGEKKLLQSEDDWKFVAIRLTVLNQNWTRFLAEQRRKAIDQSDASAKEAVEAAFAVLNKMGLDEASDVDTLIHQVAVDFFTHENNSLPGCIQLAQIAAKLGAKAGESFRYAARDERLRSTTTSVLFDEDGTLEELLPAAKRETGLLHPDYVAEFSSCSQEEWRSWVSSGRAALLTFIPFVQKRVRIYGKQRIEQEARDRGMQGNLYYPYVTGDFIVEDWDFENTDWDYWNAIAIDDELVWTKVVDRMLSERDVYWNRARTVRLLQVATTGSTRSITSESLLPTWALRFRDLPCLRDTRGFPRKPGDLLRRTPETESLMDVESFVHGRLDREATRPLLDLLGVRSTPTGPARLLDCLRTLAKADAPPVQEIEKWYRRLDQMADTCSTTDFEKIRQAFFSEKLVLTQDSGWDFAAAVFLSSVEEDVPGAAVVRSSVSNLTLWRRLGLAERPTAELAVQWLQSLPSDQALSPEDARRVRALLGRYPAKIWEECAHWLNLAGEWVRTERLSYGLTMQSLIPWRHLHDWVKHKTADLQRLSGEFTSNPPFADLPALAAHVETRFVRNPLWGGEPEMKEWLTTVGSELRRVELDTEEDTKRIRAIAQSLARTTWYTTPEIQTIPYIDGTPAGTPRNVDVLWLGESLYVRQLSRGRLARIVPAEIGQAFGRDDIKAALAYSFERLPEDVREYLEENFKLLPHAAIPEQPRDDVGAESDQESSALTPWPDSETRDETRELQGVDDETQNSFSVDAGIDQESVGISEGNASDTTDGVDARLVRPHSAAKPEKPSIIERFARAQSYRKESDERYFHEDGSWIARTKGSSFPWERRTATGDLFRCYWPKDHCLEREPLQLESHIWGLIDQNPTTYALILSNADGDAVEVTGARLRAMRDNGEVTLYPATYRLVYKDDREGQ